MSLLAAFLAIVQHWRNVFPQQRTFQRGVRQALGSLLCLGRRRLTRIIWTNGRQNRSWSAEYFLHSRCRGSRRSCSSRSCSALWRTARNVWSAWPSTIRDCARRAARSHRRSINAIRCRRRFTSIRCWVGVSCKPLCWCRCTVTLLWARALPIRFQEVSRIKRPGKKAAEEMQKQYKEAVKQKNLSRSFVDMGKQLRQELDDAGGQDKLLALAGDGSFCNRTCFGDIPERSILLVRARKDAKLCFRAAEDARRFYAVDKFTPEQVRKDESRTYKTTKIFYGGKRRKVRYKEIVKVYWQRGAKQLPLRLIVIAPTPYRKSKSKKLYCRDPAYLLTTDLRSSLQRLLQIYFDRWQIEVNHREEKDTLGVGQAQLWNITSAPKQPVLAVAAYSALLLASLQAFGAERGEACAQLPSWRRKARRPSALDLITLLRKEMTQQPQLLAPLGFEITDQALVHAAAA